MKGFNYSLIIFFISCWQHCSASRINFQAVPTNIYEAVTESFQLRCSIQRSQDKSQVDSVNDSSWPSESLTIKTALAPSHDTKLEKRDGFEFSGSYTMTDTTKTSTPEPSTPAPSTPAPFSTLPPIITEAEFSHITSIIVSTIDFFSGQHQTLASVTSFDPAQSHSDFRIKVEGQANSSPLAGELGYLQLTWDIPSNTQSGRYRCEVFGLDQSMYPVSLTQFVYVTATEPTNSDLASIIGQNNKIIRELQKKVSNLTEQISASNYQTEVNKNNIDRLTESIWNETGSLNAQNIQTGNVTCTNEYVYFPVPYKNIPTVLIVVGSEGHFQMMSGNSIDVTIGYVDRHMFRPICQYGYYNLGLSWIAIEG